MVYESPHKKRPRPGESAPWGGTFDEADYPRGSIKRIRVENFMTYKEALVYPGPRLNLVLGPNGSGKSSIVCAVGLALCATNKRLGRADSVQEFVKKGETQGAVELIISGGPSAADYRIERILTAADGSSTFRINGMAKKKIDVENLNKKLNIQLDNLCQFLPQEKVVEFSKMTPEELLLNMERAIGDANLAAMHTKLISGAAQMSELRNERETTARQLDKMQQERTVMARDVEKVREHDALTRAAANYSARTRQVHHRLALEAHEECKENLEQVQQEVKELEALQKKAEKPLKDKKAKLETLVKQAAKRKASIREGSSKVENFIAECEEYENQGEELMSELRSFDEMEEKRVTELEACRAQHRAALDKLDSIPEVPAGFDPEEEAALQAKRHALTGQMVELSQERHQLNNAAAKSEADVEMLARKLHKMSQVRQQRLEVLNRKFKGLMATTQRVEGLKQAGRFKGAVYGPIGAELQMLPNVPPHAAAALENCVKNRIWSAFVVEFPEDQMLMRREVRSANVIEYRGNPHASLRRPYGAPDAHAEHGALTSLDALFESPALIRHVLNEEARLTSAFLLRADRDADAVFRNTPLRHLYGPTKFHQKVVSRYNQAGVSLSADRLRPANMFSQSVKQDEKVAAERKYQELQAQLAGIDERRQQVDAEEGALAAQRSEIEAREKEVARLKSKHASSLRTAKNRVTTLESKISKLEQQAPLLKKPKTEKQLAKLRKICKEAMQQISERIAPQLLKDLKTNVVLLATKAQLEDELVLLQRNNEAEQGRLKECRQQVQLQQSAERTAREELKRAAARWEASRSHLQDNELGVLEELPEDEAECEAAAEEAAAKAERIAVGDRGVLERFRALEANLAAHKETLKKRDGAIAKLQGELDDAKANWLPQLEAKVAQVSHAFSDNFKRIGSCGEVALEHAGEDYAKYKIRIRVKFRDNGTLEDLSPAQHSGGEKSVSTIMFLLSLQKITDTPFRVVDEINQGMDQTNERRVFQAMVDAATDAGTAQCLLMTPKLLPQLQYSEHVNVLNIVNGAYIGAAVKRLVPSKQLRQLLGTHADGLCNIEYHSQPMLRGAPASQED